MLGNRISPVEELSDASLVAACIDGNRDAYARIVERYQRLLCSLAYSSMGHLSESEDVAQETFIEGWRKLGSLREPEKLRSWLCGILRFKVSHRLRKKSKEPMAKLGSLEALEATESNDNSVEDQTMRDEEKQLLWNALKQVPESYREPLVLFYREHKSIEHVACELDLSEDAVKQRLSRGRKMLQERMMTFVEDALERSTPGRLFTMGVIAALPAAVPTTAKAAGVGGALSQVGSVAKIAGFAAILASISGLISSFFMVRANLDQSRTQKERRYVVKNTILFIGSIIGFMIALVLLRFAAVNWTQYSGYLAGGSQLMVVAFTICYAFAMMRSFQVQGRLRAEERKAHPESFNSPVDHVDSKASEYRSKWTLFGIPLLHFKFSSAEEGERPAIGWIAFGNKAYGILFAVGGYAVGTVSVGLVSVGFLTCSAIGIGVFGMGTIAIGYLAFGAVAIGFNAIGSLSALGWESAMGGGFAIARDGALGSVAFAREVNNELAAEIASLAQFQEYHVILLCFISALVLVPLISYAKAISKRMKKG